MSRGTPSDTFFVRQRICSLIPFFQNPTSIINERDQVVSRKLINYRIQVSKQHKNCNCFVQEIRLIEKGSWQGSWGTYLLFTSRKFKKYKANIIKFEMSEPKQKKEANHSFSALQTWTSSAKGIAKKKRNCKKYHCLRLHCACFATSRM